MKQNVLEAITRFLDIAWRRRMLLALPIAIMLPLSFIASRLMPQAYVAKALLAMQESGSDNPLLKSTSNSIDRLRERAPGLQALLKSDRVLGNALQDMLGEKMPTDPRQIALATRDLDTALSFEMIGTDFLELQLKGGKREGLGRKLEAITSRFLESLVATDQDSTSAIQVLLEKRRDDVKGTEAALQRYKEQLGDRTFAAIEASNVRLVELQNTLPNLAAEISGIDAETAALKLNLGVPGTAENASRVEQLQSLEQRGAALKREYKATTANVADQLRAATDTRSPEGQLRRLERDAREARALLDSYTKRFPASLTQRSLQVLNAPERIRVIDAPHDPEFPTSSRMRIVLVGLALGMVIAGALVAAAEVLDQRLRHVADFEAAAGAPVIARLPRALLLSTPEDDGFASGEIAPDPEPPSGMRPGTRSVTQGNFGRRTAA